MEIQRSISKPRISRGPSNRGVMWWAENTNKTVLINVQQQAIVEHFGEFFSHIGHGTRRASGGMGEFGSPVSFWRKDEIWMERMLLRRASSTGFNAKIMSA